jgi:hypothetical protein
MNMTMKSLFLIALAGTIFLTGCDTVPNIKRDSIPLSEVSLFVSNHGYIVTSVPIAVVNYFEKNHAIIMITNAGFHDVIQTSTTLTIPAKTYMHLDHNAQPDYVMVYQRSVSALVINSEYMGKFRWSGTMQEIEIPEYAIGDENFDPSLADVPERVKMAVKERAAQLGANLVVLEIGGGGYQWILEDGKLQPSYLLDVMTYFKP